jgi:hypothetical protein
MPRRRNPRLSQSIRMRYIGSAHYDLDNIPRCSVHPGEEIQMPVVGYDLELSLFQRLPEDALRSDDPQPAYLLVYRHKSLELGGNTCLRGMVFTGGKPHVTFVCEDELRSNVQEFVISLRNGSPILLFTREYVQQETPETVSS